MNSGFTGTITSTVTVTDGARTREIDFIYDHNGLRTGKVVTEGEKTETTEYTLHGKLIMHMTKRSVDEYGAETVQNLHFLYDAQSRPAFMEYNGTKYRYLHNLQGDIARPLHQITKVLNQQRKRAGGYRRRKFSVFF